MTKQLVPIGTRKRMAAVRRPVPDCGPQQPVPDLDILTVVHGHNPCRSRAVATTLAQWDRYQSPMPRVYIAWCYRDGEAPDPLEDIPDYPWLVKVRMPKYDLADKVFRKEGLLNHLLTAWSSAPYILTLDADVWSEDRRWFRLIRDQLAADWCNVVQCYAHFQDTTEPQQEWAWAAHILPSHDPQRCKHPGLGWAFTRRWVDAHGDVPVFNPWHPCGSGDCAFVLEHFQNGDQLKSYASKYESLPYFQRVFRHELPEARLAAVDVEVWHQNHTQHDLVPSYATRRAFADRAYRWSREALNAMGELGQYLYLDDNGVPMLRDPNGPFARMIQRKAEMQDAESAARVVGECFGPDALPGLPNPESGPFHTMSGIGDHVLLAAVLGKMRRAYPEAPISAYLSRPGLEPWFTALCPDITFARTPGEKLVWRHGYIPAGKHAITRYGCDVGDIRLPAARTALGGTGPHIAFVTQHEHHLARKVWPHWERLAILVQERFGVRPHWVGIDTLAQPRHRLPDLLASMDAVVCTEGMASHVCWAIRQPAIVLLTGAIDPTALCYPGFHTILRGRCRHGRYCDCYARPANRPPQCEVECMATIAPETVLAEISRQLSPRVVNVHFLCPNKRHGGRVNAGDYHAGPARYFPGIEERSTSQPAVPCALAIFGGGGVYQESILPLAREYRKLGARIVIWGAGIVTEDRERGMTPWNWREFGDMADLCGLREPSPWELACCSSCMSPLFDELAGVEPEHDVVYYNHPDKPVRPGEPSMTNYDTTDLSAVLRFLASGRLVVTSSYHGRIWSTWLGRDVELDGPAVAQLAESGPIPPLPEARALTRDFWERASSLHSGFRDSASALQDARSTMT